MTTLNDVIRLTATFKKDATDLAQWVWHAKHTSGADVSNAQLILDIIATLGIAWLNIDQAIDTGFAGTILELALWDAVEQRFDTVATSDISALVGTSGETQMLPHANTGVVTFFTNLARSRGKKQIFGLMEGAQQASVLIGSVVTQLALFAADFDDAVTSGAATVKPGNFNRLTGIFREWNGTVQANVLMGSQDRRKPGVGA
ncbi:MAG: hypothetical protein KAJ07_13130 [Planctomycetes bacterium]|nr:hypothetical protein [Planctomycetota bacterium]